MELVAETTAEPRRAAPTLRALKDSEAAVFAAYRRLLLNASVDITRSIAARSALVIAPHPDDETLGCGATIARKAAAGSEVHIAFITDGRHSHRSAVISPDALARLRRAEATQAAAALGIPEDRLHFLDIPDGAASSHLDSVRGRLLELIQRHQPQDIFIPSRIDRHPDHRALGGMLESLARAGSLGARVLAYPVWFWTLKAWCDSPSQAAAAIARMTRSVFTLRPLTVLTGEHLEAKRAALAAHRSQTTRLTNEPTWATLDDAFLSHFLRRQEIFFQIAAPPSRELRDIAAPASAGFFRQVRILHMLPDLRMGGGQRLLLRNINALDGRFAHHICAVRPGSDMQDDFASAGVRLLRLDVRRAWQMPGAVLRLVRSVRHLGIDLIHTNNTGIDRLFGQLAGLIARIPVVNTVHSEYEPPARAPGVVGGLRACLRSGRSLLECLLARLTITQSIAVSDTARQSWSPIASRWGIRPGAFRVVRPAIETSPFQTPLSAEARGRLRAQLGLDDASPILLCIGRLYPGKGQGILLDALPAIRDAYPHCKLVLVGDGPYLPDLQMQAARLKVSPAVRFAGTRTDIPQLLALADLLVFPSLREGFGLVILEALAAGKPVVASRLPVFAEIVTDGDTAALFTPGDPADLARAVRSILADPARLPAMSARGREIIETKFSTARLSRELEAVYDAALAGRR